MSGTKENRVSVKMRHIVIAFSHNEPAASAELLAMEATDINALGAEFKASGLSINIASAKMMGAEVWVAVTGNGAADREFLQRFFVPSIRVLDRRELLAVAFAE